MLSCFPSYRIIPHDLVSTALVPAPLQGFLFGSGALSFKFIRGTV